MRMSNRKKNKYGESRHCLTEGTLGEFEDMFLYYYYWNSNQTRITNYGIMVGNEFSLPEPKVRERFLTNFYLMYVYMPVLVYTFQI